MKRGLSLVGVIIALSSSSSSAFTPHSIQQSKTSSSSCRLHNINHSNNNGRLSIHNNRVLGITQRSSNRGSSTSLSAVGPITTSIAQFYKTFPLIAGFSTAFTKATFADTLVQNRDPCVTKFNYKRNFAMALYSGSILGVSCEIMYNRIFPLIFGPTLAVSDAGGLARAIKMTLFDGFINAPILWLPPAYIAQALVYRYPKREAIQKYICDVKENGLLKKYCEYLIWLFVCLFVCFMYYSSFVYTVRSSYSFDPHMLTRAFNLFISDVYPKQGVFGYQYH